MGCALLFCRFSASFLFGFGVMGAVLQGGGGCGCGVLGGLSLVLFGAFAGRYNLMGSFLHFLFRCCGGWDQSDCLLLKKQGSIR